jgi:hypothetical protein
MNGIGFQDKRTSFQDKRTVLEEYNVTQNLRLGIKPKPN